LVENLSKSPRKGNPNPKDVRLTMHKLSLMMFKKKSFSDLYLENYCLHKVEMHAFVSTFFVKF
jgi:hypothetical protein